MDIVFTEALGLGATVLKGDGDGTFTDATADVGVSGGWGWGVSFFDANNDGFEDLADTDGFTSIWRGDEALFFKNPGSVPFSDVSDDVGFDNTDWGSALIAFDYDRDGDLDMFQVGFDGDPLILLANNECSGNTSLHVRPRMSCDLNYFAIGAVVEADPDFTDTMHPLYDKVLTRWITAGMSQIGQEPAEAHFGLSDATKVDITVTWPSLGASVCTQTSCETISVTFDFSDPGNLPSFATYDATTGVLTIMQDAVGNGADCNTNGTRDICDIHEGTSQDCNTNDVPDECDIDCNSNSIPDDCEDPIPQGACCEGANTCTIVEQSQCSGNFLGCGISCPDPGGKVCCLPPGGCCLLADEAWCDAQGGNYRPTLSTCPTFRPWLTCPPSE